MKWIIRQFGNVWCLFIHGFVLDKHKMHKAYGPQECQKCGRWWRLKIWTYTCLTRKYWDKSFEGYIFKKK